MEIIQNFISVSVVVCCYNSSDRIVPTLEHLSKQKLQNLTCELILVDNNCNDDTISIVDRSWKLLGNPFELRIINEHVPGLSNARKAGVKASKGEVIIFCDDDNWLHKDYVSLAFEIMENYPDVGIAGGQNSAVFDIIKPDWFDSKENGYAVGKQGFKTGYISERRIIWGAGMVLRKSVYELLLNSGIVSYLTGRNGESLNSGDDAEICKWYLLVGYELWYDERLLLSHYIPNERLTEDYVIKLWKGFDNASEILTCYDHIITYRNNLKKSNRFYIICKTFIKIIFYFLWIKKNKFKLNWNLKYLQLSTNSLILIDRNLFNINQMFNKVN